jgi:hypothetical protein
MYSLKVSGFLLSEISLVESSLKGSALGDGID